MEGVQLSHWPLPELTLYPVLNLAFLSLLISSFENKNTTSHGVESMLQPRSGRVNIQSFPMCNRIVTCITTSSGAFVSFESDEKRMMLPSNWVYGNQVMHCGWPMYYGSIVLHLAIRSGRSSLWRSGVTFASSSKLTKHRHVRNSSTSFFSRVQGTCKVVLSYQAEQHWNM